MLVMIRQTWMIEVVTIGEGEVEVFRRMALVETILLGE